MSMDADCNMSRLTRQRRKSMQVIDSLKHGNPGLHGTMEDTAHNRFYHSLSNDSVHYQMATSVYPITLTRIHWLARTLITWYSNGHCTVLSFLSVLDLKKQKSNRKFEHWSFMLTQSCHQRQYQWIHLCYRTIYSLFTTTVSI